jgi:hypothetical protein
MFGLVTQLWNQNPIVFMMVVGLVLFGMYAAIAPFREDDPDGVYTADGAHESTYEAS